MQNSILKISLLKSVYLAFFCLSFVLPAHAELNQSSADSILNSADQQFKEKSFQSAADQYLILFQNGWFAPASLLRYAWIKETSGQPEEAVFALYKYYLMTEDQAAYTKVVELTDKYNINGFEQADYDYLIRKWMMLREPISFILMALIVLFLALTVFRRRQQQSLQTLITTNLLLILALLVITNFSPSKPKAVISSPQAILMNGPSAASGLLIGSGGYGDLVTILSDEDVWVEIDVKGKRAWVKSWQIRKI